MSDLFLQRCLNHAGREAIARCPDCGHDFCRECVTEHDDRLICAKCLGKLAQAAQVRRFRFAGLLRCGQCALGILAAWFFFYLIGEFLLSVPDSFHETTLWQPSWLDRK
jgi:hypothetical protein